MAQQPEPQKKQVLESYPAIYKQVIAEWQQPGSDAFWLLYSANYLFRSGSVRWAIDPLTLVTRLTGALPLHPRQDFAKLDFLILTHKHHDHVDWVFLKSIAPLPIPWIVPDFLVDECVMQTGIAREQIIPAVAGQWVNIAGIKILPLEGHHWEYLPGAKQFDPPLKGLPCTAYLLEFHEKRWYFPGDVRAYDLSKLPVLGELDGVTAHVWLGRMKDALSDPPLFDAFCEYFSSFQTSRLTLTHLYEMGRESKDMWTLQHAQRLVQAFADRCPSLQVDARCTGERIDL